MTKRAANYSTIFTTLFTGFFLVLSPLFFQAQNTLELIAPLDIPLILSGNFGEFRGSHFHTGIDIKTQGVEGFPVLAAADGKVERIKVSPWGYGNTLYIKHSDGSSTVYAHLQSFSPSIQDWVRVRQYKGRVFSIDLSPTVDFEFYAGDTIGWSGNSGSSGGPHLHFEVRDAQQHPVNPLHWDLPITDKIPPEVGDLKVIPIDSNGLEKREIAVDAKAGDTTLVKACEVHLGVWSIDRLDGASNVCGVYSIDVEVNGEQYFSCTIDTLDFAVNQDMNAHVYFSTWKGGRKSVHRFNKLPGDRLPIYDFLSEKNLEIMVDSIMKVDVVCKDVNGNSRAKSYILKGDDSLPEYICKGSESSRIVTKLATPYAVTDLRLEGVDVHIKRGALYDSEYVFLEVFDSLEFEIGSWDVPLKKAIEVSYKLSAVMPQDLWVARSVNDKGDVSGAIVCKQEVGRLDFKTKNMGRYKMERDTVPPRLLPKHSGTPVVKNGDLIFHIDDAVSGVEKIEATMDGQWILLRWNPKKKEAIYKASDAVHEKGSKVKIEVVASDAVGLESKWSGYVKMK
ncbi:MAG: hypothetical protein CL847_06270 [Crocinitomicaceae bacterium]|nr:hypothetical protein [Crocinitomicaceae bacterium]|tara:strand:+ start:4324 stop:6015 length:1692 start_codon:yes stop_codon:yes gene_type:complete